MTDKIDVSNVITQGQFRTAIENFVKGYVADMLRGVHGSTTVKSTASDTPNGSERCSVTVGVSGTGKHYGIVDIVATEPTNTSRTNIDDTLTAPQAQIFVWWDENNGFHYVIPSNCLRGTIAPAGTYYGHKREQYIDENTVSYNSVTQQITFTIVNAASYERSRSGSTFKIDYHIW